MHEEFDNAVFDWEYFSYTLKKKFESGTTVDIEFWVEEWDRFSPNIYVGVCLRSYTKRRQTERPDFYYTNKGKDGLRPAIWATDLLLKFPEFILSHWQFSGKTNVVYRITWSDPRRRDVYRKWLSRYGFYLDQSPDGRCLSRTFTRAEVSQ